MVSVVGLLAGGVFLVLGLWQFGKAGSEFRTVYHILRNDPVSIRELPTRSGPVEIEGTARGSDDHDLIESIFTEVPCLAYEYEVEEYQSTGQHSSWQTLDEGVEYVPFLVEDETGGVRVRPEGAEFRFEEHTLRVDGGEEPPDRITEYIERTDAVDPQNKSLNVVVTEIDYGNDQRFTERRLEPGEDVYVYGTVGRGVSSGWGSQLVNASVEDGEEIPEFVLSDTSERGTAWRISKSALWKAGGGVLFCGLGVAGLLVM